MNVGPSVASRVNTDNDVSIVFWAVAQWWRGHLLTSDGVTLLLLHTGLHPHPRNRVLSIKQSHDPKKPDQIEPQVIGSRSRILGGRETHPGLGRSPRQGQLRAT